MSKSAMCCVAVLTFGVIASAQSQRAPRSVDLQAADGTPLKATFFAAARPGPGVLLLHQNTRTRTSWEPVAPLLAAAGINTLALDLRGFGESGTRLETLTDDERIEVRRHWPD